MKKNSFVILKLHDVFCFQTGLFLKGQTLPRLWVCAQYSSVALSSLQWCRLCLPTCLHLNLHHLQTVQVQQNRCLLLLLLVSKILRVMMLEIWLCLMNYCDDISHVFMILEYVICIFSRFTAFLCGLHAQLGSRHIYCPSWQSSHHWKIWWGKVSYLEKFFFKN